ncbi:hypothetical protein AQ824_25830 [Burkholderia pseudomallei]|nr:hypothetical protein AQ730_03135 [Burkholderia pseudomallei]OMS88428.1 hypothetical protein AQ748_08670 [Burkholderia pseudomallei]OMV02487.1 hypothetical protein AQ785_07490 [Burkholderia pseudomallei]OMV07341.1 hypothetical protein AQ784_22885 [Burkholderia pseudomallei]OMW55547.1 hypothetical protein AQ812_18210 [Burkholderia pseudomallei]
MIDLAKMRMQESEVLHPARAYRRIINAREHALRERRHASRLLQPKTDFSLHIARIACFRASL